MEFLVQTSDNKSSTIGAINPTERSIYELSENGNGAIKDEIPRITSIFIMFEPTTFHTAISAFHLLAAMTDVASSGILVPIATIVSPIIDSDNPNNLAISTAPSTRIFHPINNTAIPDMIHRVALAGDAIFSTVSLSSGKKLLCFTE